MVTYLSVILGLLFIVPVSGFGQGSQSPLSALTDECSSLPATLQAVVAAMDIPGERVQARVTRDGTGPFLPTSHRVDVVLLPMETVALRAVRGVRMDGSAGPFAGILAFKVSSDGVYRISLGARTWIDVMQDDTAVPRVRPVHRVHRCGQIHKSNEFSLKKGTLYWLELSGSSTPTISLMITPEEGV
jgi:hypothetical protein